jgi:phosphoribosylanthranilate isomerase
MTNKLYIKVCGNAKANNAAEVWETEPDLMGFIFHENSPRNASLFELRNFIHDVPQRTRKVGVFVNEPINNLKKLVILCDLHLAQLHGGESVDYCRELTKKCDFGVIKVFNVDDNFDFSETKPFEDVVNFFLFDTKSNKLGGSGKKFNWKKLEEYKGEKLFFLAGGIGPDDLDEIKSIKHEKLIGIDLNSGFETRLPDGNKEPGNKDVNHLKPFINALRT